MDKTKLVAEVKAESASKPRSLSPVVSRFKGWFIDVTEKAKEGKLEGVAVADGISLASKARDSSYWQFVETKNGYLIAATGGKYKGWVIGRDDSAKARPEGPNLTVVPALRLSEKVTKNSYWDLILTKQGPGSEGQGRKIQRLGLGLRWRRSFPSGIGTRSRSQRAARRAGCRGFVFRRQTQVAASTSLEAPASSRRAADAHKDQHLLQFTCLSNFPRMNFQASNRGVAP